MLNKKNCEKYVTTYLINSKYSYLTFMIRLVQFIEKTNKL